MYEHVLVPTLTPRDILLMGNLPVHKADGVRQDIKKAGWKLIYLPRYSPNFNPIEKAFSIPRAKAKRMVEALWDTVGRIVTFFEPEESADYTKPF